LVQKALLLFEILSFEVYCRSDSDSGVGDSPYQRYGESATLRINDTQSRRLSVSMIRGVGDSPYKRYAESATLRINDTRSWRLPVSLSRGVVFQIRISPRIAVGYYQGWAKLVLIALERYSVALKRLTFNFR
jgi:hypothetical protein